MRVLNEHGKLFGRVNVIDLGILVALVAGGVFVPLNYRALVTPQYADGPWGELEDTIEVVCIFDRVDEAISSTMQVGDVGRDPIGRIVAEILEVFPPEPALSLAVFGSTLSIPTKASKSLKRVVVRVRLHGQLSRDRDDGRFYFEQHPVTNGSLIDFRTEHYTVTGTIRPGVPKELFVLFRGRVTSKEMAGLLNPGDPIYDRQGVVAGRVIGGRILGTTQLFGTQALEMARTPEPLFQAALPDSVHEAQLWVALSCWVHEAQVVFGEQVLKVGTSLILRSGDYDLAGEILQLSESVPEEALSVSEPVWRYLRVRLEDTLAEVVRLISPGDPIYSAGFPAGEVVTVIAQASSRKLKRVSGSEGSARVSLNAHPEVEVELWVKVQAFQGSRLFFGGAPLKIGNPFSLQSDEYDLGTRILEIREELP